MSKPYVIDTKCPYCGGKDRIFTNFKSGLDLPVCFKCNKQFIVKWNSKGTAIGKIDIKWVSRSVSV